MSPSTAPQAREAAERTIASLPAAVQTSAGFTAMEVSLAQEGVIRQLTDATQPERQVFAARAISTSDIQTPVGAQNIPAATIAREMMAAPITQQAKMSQAPSIRSVETSFNQMTVPQQVEALKFAATELRSNDADSRASAERIVTFAPKKNCSRVAGSARRRWHQQSECSGTVGQA